MKNKPFLLRNLHTFEVASQHLSFTKAGIELNLTQGAVSHRIKGLEADLGFKLFIRRPRKLELTLEGKRLKATLAESLSSIYSEIEDINSHELTGNIVIATTPAFASGWLIPRLKNFKKKYPGFNLTIRIEEDQLDLRQNNIDIAVYYGQPNLIDTFTHPLFDERLVPVCTHEYAVEHGLFQQDYEALKGITFLHAQQSNAWQRWLDHFSIALDPYDKAYHFSQRGMHVQAAKHSLGVAIGRLSFVAKMIEDGELVVPFPTMHSQNKYYLLCANGMEKHQKIEAVFNWIKEERASRY
ncbi:transcriptional regulator [Vibrio sp. UCD-FRSSP16_10]|uniref:LysR substrate-binding domain-containing protein n=1 Tax=unclassified Vibrio TaxID=2614977 RepID=UPI0007FC1289|nr:MULTISPECIES: LysR substrate-binding domain-containing protein [unclassified Vibrio]OBT06540.1 transcriptional regulator [Vibrio sp. UCD-FRSSP16_30]OBT12237.1 transcriptional regulator [Vibrio sp. UCD-FRSSP16_10]